MTTAEVLAGVQDGTITADEASKLLQEKKLKLKVSQKGAVQLDGLRRFPVTLYKTEWKQIFEMKDQIEKFITENDKKLSVKGDD